MILLNIICINIIGLLIIFIFYKNYLKSLVDSILPRCNNMYIKESQVGGKYGRGVFASMDFNKNEILEMTPYIEDDTENFIGVVRDYVFTKDYTNSIGILAFGFISLCNHNDNPNTKWIIEDKYMILKTIKPIKKDEEILVSYGPNYWSTRPNMSKVQ